MTTTSTSRARQLATFWPHRFLQVARTAPRKVHGLVADGVDLQLPPRTDLAAVLANVDGGGHATSEATDGAGPLRDAALAVLASIVGALTGGNGGTGVMIDIADDGTLTIRSTCRDGDPGHASPNPVNPPRASPHSSTTPSTRPGAASSCNAASSA